MYELHSQGTKVITSNGQCALSFWTTGSSYFLPIKRFASKITNKPYITIKKLHNKSALTFPISAYAVILLGNMLWLTLHPT